MRGQVPSDLMAIAFVRRALLELGAELQPEAHVLQDVGPLEPWIHEPLDGLDGMSPMQVLEQPDGELLLRAFIERALGAQGAEPDQNSLFGGGLDGSPSAGD